VRERSAAITEPGFHDVPEHEYHADPVEGGSLSSTGARMLLRCPALYRYRMDNPERRSEFDFGSAAHKLVLDDGPDIAVLDYDDWRTKAAREARDNARSWGQIPLLRDDYKRVCDMAGELAAHPEASDLLTPRSGKAEQTIVWRGSQGMWLRARLDWTRDDGTIVDYKTTHNASPGAIAKSVYDYGYHQQEHWYTTGAMEVSAAYFTFRFVFQEKTPPYLVTVVNLDSDAVTWGGVLNRKAIDVYQRCQITGAWPGYADKTVTLSLPGYALANYERADERGDFYVSEVPF